ncbi:TrmH family RNA methyltransferase [Gaetbulibacter aestuarii]|uniref:TrmH family RNA methyltransferase n=1 Tax=Gaetbulibacter aestuarii TaxID=1502358 RepID=A0ABW7N3D8_9FLAO
MKQLTHYNSKFKERRFPIVLVCDNVNNAPNIGSLFRTADAFGIEKLILCGEHIHLGRKIKKTSRATEKTVSFEMEKDINSVLLQLKNENYKLVSLEITENSSPIRKYKFAGEKPIALIVGAENEGISEEVLKLSDTVLHIDMFGLNSSMNVVQASTIALYEITSQLQNTSE